MLRAELPRDYNAVEILERSARTTPDRLALLSPERSATFLDVLNDVNRAGNALRSLGVRAGDVVAIYSLDCYEWVVGFFAALKIGAVALSVNTLITPGELRYVLDESRARVVLVHQSLTAKANAIRGGLGHLQHVITIGGADDGFRALLAGHSERLEQAKTHPDDICCLNYSSGTTGEPKGIPHSHADLVLTAQHVGTEVLGIRPTDRTYAVARLFFTFGTGGNLLFPWHVGASIVLSAESPRDPRVVLNIIRTFRPTVLFNVPTGYGSLLATKGFPEEFDLSSLRLCVSAGEALPSSLWTSWRERTGLEIVEGIGTTENYHMFICNRPGEARPGSSGKPVPGYEVKVVGESGALLGPGEVGDLLVKGETAALSYHRKYQQSRKAFVGEWLRTGDKYRYDEDGFYYYAGRSDDMMKVGGIWVAPTEVENTLLSHHLVAQCAVVAKEDESGLVKPKAYVVAKEGTPVNETLAQELIDYCVERMSAHKRPRWVEFVSELPMTATGKIQRFRLHG